MNAPSSAPIASQIFVNLPVKDLKRAVDFFAKLGFTFNADFTDDKATCMIVGDNIYAMLLTESFFQTFTGKPVADARTSTEVLTCIALASREAVDKMVADAVTAGGAAPRPAKDHGFMYQHGFEDLDGHIWELVYLRPAEPA
jgi:predicted lactoylglutathione lyase